MLSGIHPSLLSLLILILCIIKLNGIAAAVVGGQMAFADIRPYQPFRSC